MKFTVRTDELRSAVTAACRLLLPGREVSLSPALACIKIVANAPDAISIHAANRESLLRLDLPAEVVNSGECLAPGQQLRAWLAEFPADEVGLCCQPSEATLSVSAPGSVATLPTRDVNEFPVLHPGNTVFSATLSPGALSLALARVRAGLRSCDLMESYTYSNLVFIEAESGGLAIVGTDTRTCSAARIPVAVAGLGSALLPLAATTLIPVVASSDLRCEFSANTACFTGDNGEYITRLREGRYLPWRKVMPEVRAVDAVVNTSEFAAAIRRVASLADPLNDRLDCLFEPGQLTIRTGPGQLIAQSQVELAISYSGNPVSVGLAAGYLRDFTAVLPKCGPEEIGLTLPPHRRQGLHATCGPDWDYMIMPLANK